MKPEYESPTIEIFSFATNEIMCSCDNGYSGGGCTCVSGYSSGGCTGDYCLPEVS